ncbi:MAG: diaminopimelate epimerase [Oscillospiraceae bacterium]|nr:diaminopimelate epimerase [Oscillospiraceae bacterium]
MRLHFTKMHGAGNDYIYIDCMRGDVALTPQQIASLSRRRFGVGADGVIFIRPAEGADGFMDMYNADGTPGAMCGNGVRCVGKYLFDNGYAKSPRVTVATRSGLRALTMDVAPDGTAAGASVDMGPALLACADIPVLWDGDSLDVPLEAGGAVWHATCVSMGNPHAVLFVDDPDAVDLGALGPLFEHHPLFPARVNTEFVAAVSPTRLRMRVWERGSGETLACGTGACAAAVAAVRRGLCARETPIAVALRGGELEIVFHDDGRVTMRGGAVTVFTGDIEL